MKLKIYNKKQLLEIIKATIKKTLDSKTLEL